MSNGGMMAQALACKYPTLFKGVVNVVGMQHKDLSCIPDKPVNFIIYGGLKDRSFHQLILRLQMAIYMSQWTTLLMLGQNNLNVNR